MRETNLDKMLEVLKQEELVAWNGVALTSNWWAKIVDNEVIGTGAYYDPGLID